MSLSTTITKPESPAIAETLFVDSAPFLKAIVQQIRANDAYGTYRTWSDALLLKPYVLSKKQRREISVEGEVNPVTQARIIGFYRAIAPASKRKRGSFPKL